MAVEYSAKDILDLVEKARASSSPKSKSKEGNFTSDTEITPFVGKSKDPVISAGFKLKHGKTGLTYTVNSVSFDDRTGDVSLLAVSGDGQKIVIPSSEFKLYQRL